VAGLELQQGFRDSVGAGLMIELLAWIAASKSEFERAACLLGTATSVWRSIGTGIAAFGPELAEHHERCAERTVRALRRPAFQAAFEQGVRPTVEEAIAYATRRRTSGGERSPAPVLTRREHEVAVLIGQGLSNRQIAERMVISPRTVDTHVEHVLAKLGFSARTQIAAWVAEQQAVESH
jgi:DNA-binding CsgD family transcriptional regulator